jgi:hypothetical protein
VPSVQVGDTVYVPGGKAVEVLDVYDGVWRKA